MDAWRLINRYKRRKPCLLEPVTDEQQLLINERVDSACNARLHMNPSDPRAVPYLRSALWLWK